jgi:hypothetical protein
MLAEQMAERGTRDIYGNTIPETRDQWYMQRLRILAPEQ